MNKRREVLKNIGIAAGLANFPINNLFAGNFELADPLIPVLIKPDEGEKMLGSTTTYMRKIRSEHTGGAFSSILTTLENGYLGAPPHLHQNLDEIMYVIDGTVTVMAGTEVVEVEAGGWHFRPRKLVHTFWNTCGKKAKFIDIFLPGGFDDYLFKLAALFQNPDKVDMTKVTKLVSENDIEVRFDLIDPLIKKYGLKM